MRPGGHHLGCNRHNFFGLLTCMLSDLCHSLSNNTENALSKFSNMFLGHVKKHWPFSRTQIFSCLPIKTSSEVISISERSFLYKANTFSQHQGCSFYAAANDHKCFCVAVFNSSQDDINITQSRMFHCLFCYFSACTRVELKSLFISF